MEPRAAHRISMNGTHGDTAPASPWWRLNIPVTNWAKNTKAAGSKENRVMSMTADPTLPAAQSTQTRSTQAMMDRIAQLRSASTAEALRALRTAFPEIPLAARVTALEAARRADADSSR